MLFSLLCPPTPLKKKKGHYLLYFDSKEWGSIFGSMLASALTMPRFKRFCCTPDQYGKAPCKYQADVGKILYIRCYLYALLRLCCDASIHNSLSPSIAHIGELRVSPMYLFHVPSTVL